MTRFEDVSDNLDTTSHDVEEMIERLLSLAEDQREDMEDTQQTLERMSEEQIVHLYGMAYEGLDSSDLEQLQTETDALRAMSGLEPFFENMPEHRRPDEIYDGRENETSRRGFMKKAGRYGVGATAAGVVLGTVAAYLDGEYPDESESQDDEIEEILGYGSRSDDFDTKEASSSLLEEVEENDNYTLIFEDYLFRGGGKIKLEENGNIINQVEVDSETYRELMDKADEYE